MKFIVRGGALLLAGVLLGAEQPILSASDQESEKALAAYEAILLENPFDRKALEGVGYILYRGMYYERSREMYARALEEGGDSFQPLLMLGNIAFHQGFPVKAREYYLRAAKLRPDEPLIAANLELAEENIRRAMELAHLAERTTLLSRIAAILGGTVLILILLLELTRRKTGCAR